MERLNKISSSSLLPKGRSGFESLRKSDQIYVDKTEMINAIASCNGAFFLTRPRRFGKTLLVNTFESLFRHGLEYFKGLTIEQEWKETRCYPVLHLDFSDCRSFNSFAEFSAKFASMLCQGAKNLGKTLVEIDGKRIKNVIDQYNDMFDCLDLNSLVILIDEYDAPLTACMDDQKLFDKVASLLSEFYDRLKKFNPKFRFLFITGICRFQNLGLFSGANNLTDLSMDQAYGTLLGYTEKEIRQYFSPYVERNAEFLGLSFDECLLQMKRHYDGFCFDEDGATHVFNPWSVLSFLAKATPKFENFWYETAGNATVLLNYLKSHSLKDPSDYGKDQIVSKNELASCRSLSELNDVALLILTGYLTIKEKLSDRVFLVNYPNEETVSSMVQLYGGKFCFQERNVVLRQ